MTLFPFPLHSFFPSLPVDLGAPVLTVHTDQRHNTAIHFTPDSPQITGRGDLRLLTNRVDTTVDTTVPGTLTIPS